MNFTISIPFCKNSRTLFKQFLNRTNSRELFCWFAHRTQRFLSKKRTEHIMLLPRYWRQDRYVGWDDINNKACCIILQPPWPQCHLKRNNKQVLAIKQQKHCCIHARSKSMLDVTLTTNFAAISAGKPLHDLAAISEDKASQIPSEAITSLPPAFES